MPPGMVWHIGQIIRNIRPNALLATDALAQKSVSRRAGEHAGGVCPARETAPYRRGPHAGVDKAAAVRTGRWWPDGVLTPRLDHSAEAMFILG
jgi:hypothetical protein